MRETRRVTKMILSDRRKNLEPFHLEMLIFLNFNKELWTEVTMQDILSVPEPSVADGEEEDYPEDEQEEEEQEAASEPDDEDDEN